MSWESSGCGKQQHEEVLTRNDAYDGEEGSLWLPAQRTAACMIVKNIAGDYDLHLVTGAVAMQFSTREAVTSLGETIVE